MQDLAGPVPLGPGGTYDYISISFMISPRGNSTEDAGYKLLHWKDKFFIGVPRSSATYERKQFRKLVGQPLVKRALGSGSLKCMQLRIRNILDMSKIKVNMFKNHLRLTVNDDHVVLLDHTEALKLMNEIYSKIDPHRVTMRSDYVKRWWENTKK